MAATHLSLHADPNVVVSTPKLGQSFDATKLPPNVLGAGHVGQRGQDQSGSRLIVMRAGWFRRPRITCWGLFKTAFRLVTLSGKRDI